MEFTLCNRSRRNAPRRYRARCIWDWLGLNWQLIWSSPPPPPSSEAVRRSLDTFHSLVFFFVCRIFAAHVLLCYPPCTRPSQPFCTIWMRFELPASNNTSFCIFLRQCCLISIHCSSIRMLWIGYIKFVQVSQWSLWHFYVKLVLNLLIMDIF